MIEVRTRTHDDETKCIDVETKLSGNLLLAASVLYFNLVVHKIINFIC